MTDDKKADIDVKWDDGDGHCKRCGCELEEGLIHECPPGFTTHVTAGGPETPESEESIKLWNKRWEAK